MSQHRARLTAIVALVAVILVSAALIRGSEGQALQGEYKIGVLEPLTGPLAFEGKRHLEGYEIMRDMINERGGVMGKMISPQSLAVATAACGMVGEEGTLFRFTLKHSLFLTVIVGIIVYLQAYVLPWMIP